jgi:hypothetical protein
MGAASLAKGYHVGMTDQPSDTYPAWLKVGAAAVFGLLYLARPVAIGLSVLGRVIKPT